MSKECRFCKAELSHIFVDLNVSPLANSYLSDDNLNKPELYYPLYTFVCDQCFLVQLQQYELPKHIFREYAYFSSFSDSWLNHAKQYVEMAINKFKLNENSQVVEIASNDGYLLQYFKGKNIPAAGIEPARNVAKHAIEKGIHTYVEFFSEKLSNNLVSEGLQADLIIANNVIAHVPDLMDFIRGLKVFLKEEGTITIEVPHLLELINKNQFDTIYHEHFSYFSLLSLANIFSSEGLILYDVEQLPTHGGSLRVYLAHESDMTKVKSVNVSTLLDKEYAMGMNKVETYKTFNENLNHKKFEILEFFIQAKRENKTIVGYGAPAKGNTLLNYCGIGKEFLPYTVDRNHHKQGLFLPGSRIPIKPLEEISITKPDYVFILPWNLKDEIVEQMSFIREWGGQFLIATPQIEVV